MAGMFGANLADLDQLRSMFDGKAGEVQSLESKPWCKRGSQ